MQRTALSSGHKKANLSHFIPLWLRPAEWLVLQLDQSRIMVRIAKYNDKYPARNAILVNQDGECFSSSYCVALEDPPCTSLSHRHLQQTTAERLKQLNEKLPLEATALNPLTLYVGCFIWENAVYVCNPSPFIASPRTYGWPGCMREMFQTFGPRASVELSADQTHSLH